MGNSHNTISTSMSANIKGFMVMANSKCFFSIINIFETISTRNEETLTWNGLTLKRILKSSFCQVFNGKGIVAWSHRLVWCKHFI